MKWKAWRHLCVCEADGGKWYIVLAYFFKPVPQTTFLCCAATPLPWPAIHGRGRGPPIFLFVPSSLFLFFLFSQRLRPWAKQLLLVAPSRNNLHVKLFTAHNNENKGKVNIYTICTFSQQPTDGRERNEDKKQSTLLTQKNNRGTSQNLVPFTPLRNLNTNNLEFVRQMGSLFTERSGDWKKLENAHHKRDVGAQI